MDANAGDEVPLETERLTFYPSAFKLLEMASIKVALELWHAHVSQTEFEQYVVMPCSKDTISKFDVDAKSYDNLEKAVKNLSLPQCLRERIETSLERIHYQMMQYIFKLFHSIFGKNLRKYWINQFNPKWWVWYENGEIAGKQSAMNMIWAPELNQVQKFIIMCAQRVFDDMKVIDIFSLPPEFIEEMNFEQNPMVFYWICYLRNELHKIPLGNLTSIDLVMAPKCLYDGYSWFEYFWDRLDVEDQISVVARGLRCEPFCRFQIRLMFKMSLHQQNRLLILKPAEIITSFWLAGELENAFMVWKRVSHRCTIEQFSFMIRFIFREKNMSEKDMQLLLDVWNSAGDHLKNNFEENAHRDVVYTFGQCSLQGALCIKLIRPAPSAYSFLYQFLLVKDARYRKEKMRKLTEYLATFYCSSLIMKDVLELCFPDDDELRQFKNSILVSFSTRNYSTMLFNRMMFARLSLMLKIYSADDNACRGFVKRLLESKKINKPRFMFSHAKWTALSQFIDEIYSDGDREGVSSLDIKKKFVMSFAASYSYNWHHTVYLNELDKIVESILTPEEIKVFRRMLAKRLPKVVHRLDSKETYVRNFLSWCKDDKSRWCKLRSGSYKWIYLPVVLVSMGVAAIYGRSM